MKIDVSVVISCISAFVALFAALVSYKVYRNSRTLENENHIYKYQLDHFQPLVVAAYEMLDVIDENIAAVKEIQVYDDEMIEEVEEDLDDATDLFRGALIEHSLFLPTEIVKKLENFYEAVFAIVDVDFYDLAKADFDYEEFENQFMNIVNQLRNETFIDEMNLKLRKRLKGK
ncbi:hypothetical protein [Ferruginibacter sp. HRS2-29]|uniref:hypothetical protein n=1 Tax=Ferruginibacter sp. HRS2-29 TaxID=2487334 RepID=UPI0020CC1243|nr:hypothetical protein [Ferruginibacter sp. HRS2-29]MCP9749669.1 hypothetical protein [Ferruginibacter sp. HRS2-29]